MNWGHMGGWGGFGMILFWIILIAGVVLLVRFISVSAGNGRKRGESAREVLDKRYARGEISKEEYEETRKRLSA